jgi:hypothetical protein
MTKIWVLDTETKGTGAEMVPLEKVLERRPARSLRPEFTAPRRDAPEPPAPEPVKEPYRFKVVDVMTREVVAEDADPRTTLDLLRRFRSVVDVAVSVWDAEDGRYRLLTLGEQKRLWELRGSISRSAGV